MARLPNYMTRIDTSSGVRYEVRVHARRGDGSRFQHKRRFGSVDEAKAWHSRVSAELAAGTHTAPSDMTVRHAVEAWLRAKSARVKPTTTDAYRAALQPVIDRYGDVKVQHVTKADVEALITELRTGTSDRGVWARTSINPMLARWRKVWADLHAEGVVARNVVALVEPLRKPSGEPTMKTDDSLSEAEVAQLLDAHADSADDYTRRREPFLYLALLGLRRAELAGLRWSAVDLAAEVPTLTVRETRVSTSAGIIEQTNAKTVSSARTLPIPPHVVAILGRVCMEQAQRRRLVGHLWEGDGDGHVIALDLGAPLSPRTLDRWWGQSLDLAGLPHRRLHASRHTAASLLAARGAPVPLIAAWLGHADGGVLAMRTYVHTHSDALVSAAALLSGSGSPVDDPAHQRSPLLGMKTVPGARSV